MKFARVVFYIAGIWGVLLLIPLYFLFDITGRTFPPPITHAEFYYGFLSVTLAWQIAFLVIATDPPRYRLIMPAAILEKFGYIVTLILLYARGQLQLGQVAPAVPDFILGALFIAAFFKTSGPADLHRNLSTGVRAR
jgi:hypothetical protein